MRTRIAWISLLFLASVARAQPGDIDQARRYFEAGRQAYESGQYVAAIDAFDEAYRLVPRPQIVFSTAQAARRQFSVDRDPRWLKRAVTLYRQYLVEVPQGGRRADAAQYVGDLEPLLVRLEEESRRAGRGALEAMPARAEETQLMITSRTPGARASIDEAAPLDVPVVRTVAAGKHRVRVEAPGHFADEVESVAVKGRLVVAEVTLKEMPAVVTLTAPEGALVTVDGRPAGEAPLAVPLELPAGRHFLAVTRDGHYPYTRELAVQRGEQVQVAADLETTTQRVVAFGVLGGAAALLAAGGATTWLALDAQGDAEDLLGERDARNLTAAERDRYADLRADRDDWRTRSTWLYAGGAALAVGGALLYLVDSPRVSAPPPAVEAPVTPAPAPGDLGMGLGGRF